jgi:hypothetical protein
MTTEKLDKAAWHPYFDAVSKLLPGRQAEIEVDSLDIGAQLASDYAPLLGIVYDHQNDLIEVILEGLDHTIAHASEIYIDHDGVRLNSVAVTDGDGRRQIIRLRDPVMLPAPPFKAGASHH